MTLYLKVHKSPLCIKHIHIIVLWLKLRGLYCIQVASLNVLTEIQFVYLSSSAGWHFQMVYMTPVLDMKQETASSFSLLWT